MFSADLYTKVVLTIIAACLIVLCAEQSHWSRLDTVQAQSGQVLIGGYIVDNFGSPRIVHLGVGSDNAHGIPVVMVK